MSSCTQLIYDLKSLLDILLLTFPEKLGSTQVFGGFHVFHLFSFLCCVQHLTDKTQDEDNPETLATFDRQDTGRRQTKHKNTTQHNTEN
jgi:hypothetical protein